MSSLLIVVFFSILRHTSLIVKKKPNTRGNRWPS